MARRGEERIDRERGWKTDGENIERNEDI